MSQLTTANGAPINAVGYTEHTVTLMGHSYPWRFLVADVSMSILGADFLAEHELTVNISQLALCSPAGCMHVNGAVAAVSSLGLRTVAVDPRLATINYGYSVLLGHLS